MKDQFMYVHTKFVGDILTLTLTAGGLSHLRTAGGDGWPPPPPPRENSKTKKDSDKR